MESLAKANHRHTTDKYWSGLFIVILICWTISWQHAVIHHKIDDAFFSENSTSGNDTSQLVFHETNYNIFSENNAVAKNISEFSNHDVTNKTSRGNDRLEERKINFTEFLYELLGDLACNMSPLTKWGKTVRRGPDLTIKGLMGSIHFVISLILMRANEVLNEQPFIIGATFLSVALLEHLSVMCHSNYSVVTSSLPFHEKLSYWIIPETMFLVILLSKMASVGGFKKREDPCAKKISGDDDGNNEYGGDDSKDNSIYRKFPFHYYVYSVMIGSPIIIMLNIMLNSTINILYKIGWSSGHSYIIAGGSFYVGFTFYYFALMVTSYTFATADKDSSQSMRQSFQRALFVVARYHFGTACYHATLIFPRLHTNFVMKESALEPFIRNYSKLETHLKIYKLSTSLTSVAGTSHSESIRNLLRLYFGGLLSKRSLQDFGSISKSLLPFLLSTNCFVIIALADFGALDDRLSVATWIMYLKMVFIFNWVMGFITSASDAFELSMVQSDYGDLTDENLYKTVLQWMFEDESSDARSDDKVSV